MAYIEPSDSIIQDALKKSSAPPPTHPADTRKSFSQTLQDPSFWQKNASVTPPPPKPTGVKQTPTTLPKKQTVMVAGKPVLVTFDKPPTRQDIKEAQEYHLRNDYPELGAQYDRLNAQIAKTPRSDPKRGDLVVERDNLMTHGKAAGPQPSDSLLTPNNPIQNLSDSINRGFDNLDTLTKIPKPALGGNSLRDVIDYASDKGKQAIEGLRLDENSDPNKVNVLANLARLKADGTLDSDTASKLAGMIASGLDIKNIPGNELITDPKKFNEDWSQNSIDFQNDPSLKNYAKGVSQLAMPGISAALITHGLIGMPGIAERGIRMLAAGGDVSEGMLSKGKYASRPSMRANDLPINGPKPPVAFEPPTSSVDGSTSPTTAPVQPWQSPDVQYPGWREHTQAFIDGIDKHIADNKIPKSKSGNLRSLKFQLKQSLADGIPHPGIIDELTAPAPDVPANLPTVGRRGGKVQPQVKSQLAEAKAPQPEPKPAESTKSPIAEAKAKTEESGPGESTETKEKPKKETKPKDLPIKEPVKDLPIKEPGAVTGIANRHTEAGGNIERHKPVINNAEEARVEGRKAIQSGEVKPGELAQEIVNKPRPTTDIENGALLEHRVDLHNQENELEARKNRTSDPAERKAIVAKIKDIHDQLDLNHKATVYGGTEASSSLLSRRGDIPINEADKSQALAAARGAKGSKPLSAKETKKVLDASAKVKEANAKIAEAEEKASQTAAKEKAESEIRSERKSLTKEAKDTLDKEYENLKSKAIGNHTPRGRKGGSTSLPDPIVIGKMVKNRIQKGVVIADDIFHDIHDALKDQFPGLTVRDVKDLYSGYGKEPSGSTTLAEGEKIKARQTATAIKSQAKAESVAEDARKGIFKEPPSRMPALTKEVEQARKARDLANLEARDLRAKMTPKSDAKKLEELVKTNVMTSTSVFGHLAGATAGQLAIAPVEELVAPLFRKILPGAGTDVYASIEGEGKVIETLLNRKDVNEWMSNPTIKDTIQKLKTGHNELDVEAEMQGIKSPHGNRDNGLLNMLHNAHGAMKTPLQRAAFAREYQKVLEDFARKKIPIGEAERSKAFAQAYAKSQQAILMNDGVVVDAITKGLSGIPGSKIFIPIARVPVNFAGRTLEYTHGELYAIVKYANEVRKSGLITKIDGKLQFNASALKMSAENQGIIARALKRGLVGKGLMALGMASSADQLSVDKDDNLFIDGHQVPAVLSHIPWIQALKMGVLTRDSNGDGFLDKYVDASKKTGASVAKHTPFANVATDIAYGVKSGDSLYKLAKHTAGNMFIPAIAKQAYKSLNDQDWFREFMKKQ